MVDRIVILLLVVFTFTVSCVTKNDMPEITVENAIRIAADIAKSKNYNMQDTAVEVIKYKKEFEKGPIRLDWLIHTFPRDEVPALIKNDFWLVYIYPKKVTMLGGDFCVLVDLYTGKVIATKAGK